MLKRSARRCSINRWKLVCLSPRWCWYCRSWSVCSHPAGIGPPQGGASPPPFEAAAPPPPLPFSTMELSAPPTSMLAKDLSFMKSRTTCSRRNRALRSRGSHSAERRAESTSSSGFHGAVLASASVAAAVSSLGEEGEAEEEGGTDFEASSTVRGVCPPLLGFIIVIPLSSLFSSFSNITVEGLNAPFFWRMVGAFPFSFATVVPWTPFSVPVAFAAGRCIIFGQDNAAAVDAIASPRMTTTI
mmetsp:Transcript_50719/g.108091  ORF Transcript_50719/g.108091 Transcript_50719/m.108091 type:complete len:243 (+) Transcript_50719:1659-2387(+)